jgi:ubiquinone biosynthesis protein UbiJ
MFPDLSALLADRSPAKALAGLAGALGQPALDRLVLLLNHVLSREAVAMERLRPHAGARLEVQADPWVPLLPPPPVLRLRITPAGLLEACPPDEPGAPALRVRLDMSQPLAVVQSLADGRVPAAQVAGDARLAAEVDWLIAHLRWDLMDDLEAVFGQGPAQFLTLAGQAVSAALARFRPGSAQPEAAADRQGP